MYKSYLNNFNTINYFAGYNKLIIEFKEKKENNNFNNSLLFINPFQLIDNNYKSYIISFKNNEKDEFSLYQKILQNKIYSNYKSIKNIRNYNIVDEDFDEYININNFSSLYGH